MNYLTQFGLNLLQKANMDYLVVKALNNRIFSPLLLKYGWQKRDYLSYCEQYQVWQEKLEKNSVTFKDKKILEVGSGGSIGLGYFFLSDNFRFWLSTDLHHDLKIDGKLIKREASLIKEIFKNYNKNIFNEVKIRGNSLGFGKRFDFRLLQIADRAEDLIANFDVIISSAVLEHIPRPAVKKTLANLKSYLKAGGLMIHEIDLRDHVNLVNPFAFYEYGRDAWDKLTGQTIFYSNRLRLVDYLKMFDKLNFKIKFSEIETESLPKRIKIDEIFRKYSQAELAVIRVFIILEKL